MKVVHFFQMIQKEVLRMPWGGKRKGSGRKMLNRARRVYYLTDKENDSVKAFIKAYRDELKDESLYNLMKKFKGDERNEYE